ncbi:MAG TPA: FlgD immunoglobulin-like domain containing protein [Solirubrobacteraceae bacterium]|nr:FlgD immunoglobulin-like domain containing protein [Solirubrobacteraceae bacterium]
MRRLPAFVFAVLAIATAGAFFIVQHLKVTTPLLAGVFPPAPAAINPVAGQVCGGVDHRRAQVSFYLLHRSDSVDVYVRDASGTVVATLATGRYMPGGTHARREAFYWNGVEDSGAVAPDGYYTIDVDLIHQGRSIVLSPGNGAPPYTIKVETQPPHPVVRAVAPAVVPAGRSGAVSIRFSGNEGHAATVQLYRTDVPGRPELIASFVTGTMGSARWDGRVAGQPAPAGIYLVGLSVTDAACNTGHFPARLPPPPGTTRGAGVTVRYAAAQPPLTPVPAGALATVEVDTRGRPYTWALRRMGQRETLAHGDSAGARELHVRLPAREPGLYELAIRTGTHRTTVPLVAGAPRPAPVLVVLPALTWQGLSLVDSTGDGLPTTLAAGDDVPLSRWLVGPPPGLEDEAALLDYLAATHRPFDLTTDLGLVYGLGPRLAGHRGVILAGSERWLPETLRAALLGYVRDGGHVLSLGLQSLRAGVRISGGEARDPGPLSATDAFGLRHAPLVAHSRALQLAISDRLSLFAHASGYLQGFSAYEPITGVQPPGRLLTSAGPTPGSLSVAGVQLGAGTVIEVGFPGFASSLARNLDARDLFSGIWTELTG